MFRYNKVDKKQSKDEIHMKCLSYAITEYQWLINAYNVDYFVANHWSKVPKSWSKSLEKFEFEDIYKLLSNDSTLSINTSVLPLSLLSLRATCSAYQLVRRPIPDSEPVVAERRFSLKDKLLESELNESKHPKMKYEILNRHIKHKKRHEIARLSHLTDQIVKCIPDCSTIVDCGSGQGHLSRILSLCFGYNVISIEGNCHNVFGAENKDTNTLKSLSRYKLMDKIHSEFPKKFNHLLNKSSSISELTDNCENHILLGLHACGPLSTIILNQFRACVEAKALVLMSCCYMKIDTNSFPMSQLVKRLSIPMLSYEAKELACHAIEKFINKLKTKHNLDSLKVHCFRAIVESLIDKYNPNMRHKGLKRVKIDEEMTFGEYFHKAVYGLDIVVPEEELSSEFVNKCVEHQKRVVIFYSLRVLIAPLVETLILLDFINYLKEKGIGTALSPLFDPILSPRNTVLIAIK